MTRVAAPTDEPLAPVDGAIDDPPTASADPSASPAGPVAGVARGDRVGRYDLVERIGAGGMGVVYRARDRGLSRDVAVKLVRVEHPAGDRGRARQRLLREAQALAQLSHPNVVSVFDVGTHGDEVFFAMELVSGRTLREIV